MKKLVLFGDSLFGQCSKDEILFLETALKNEYDVYNCATGGWNSDDLVKKAPFISKLKPDVVLISVGTNDASPWKLVELKRFSDNLQHIAEAFNGVRAVFFPPPPVNERRRPPGKEISNATMQTYNQAVIDFCNEQGLEYWDSWDGLLTYIDRPDDPHNEDGVHFSDEGYEVVLSNLARAVLR